MGAQCHAWARRPLLCLDTETTGVNVFADRIVQVAVVTVSPDGEASDGWETIVNPGVEIPEGAEAVHGISTERAKIEGVSPAVALVEVANRIWNHQQAHKLDGAPIVMFNARFDWPLLLAEADRHNVDFPVAAPILDPYVIDRMVDRFRKGKRQLAMVCEHYGVVLAADEAHGALADATAAGRVMRAILDANPKIAAHPLAGVILRQVHGHESDRQSFVDYMRRQVNPDFDSPAGWPIPVEAAR